MHETVTSWEIFPWKEHPDAAMAAARWIIEHIPDQDESRQWKAIIIHDPSQSGPIAQIQITKEHP